ncbi:MAG: ATP-binding cassette domain-containing protein [Proteobacteria bacterium]|nr:ATP-binding cassette domain-containing protein [Pseudomonadota bacterium]
MTDPLLRVEQLKKHFAVQLGSLRRRVARVKAVDGVSFELHRGRTLGLVGESGCGKSTTGRAILRLVEPDSGRVHFRGQDLLQLDSRALRRARSQMQIVFQDPHSSLNPRQTIGDAVGSVLLLHGRATRATLRSATQELLERVGLPSGYASRYPHELSGGERQRAGLARALAPKPSFIVCDEPVSALDVSVQAQVLNLFLDLRDEYGLSYLFITHDLLLVGHIAHAVAVMYLGQIVELGPSEQVLRAPMHPYTQALISSLPRSDPGSRRERVILQGEVPNAVAPPGGCRFHPRCPVAMRECTSTVPALYEIEGRRVRCLNYRDAG